MTPLLVRQEDRGLKSIFDLNIYIYIDIYIGVGAEQGGSRAS